MHSDLRGHEFDLSQQLQDQLTLVAKLQRIGALMMRTAATGGSDRTLQLQRIQSIHKRRPNSSAKRQRWDHARARQHRQSPQGTTASAALRNKHNNANHRVKRIRALQLTQNCSCSVWVDESNLPWHLHPHVQA